MLHLFSNHRHHYKGPHAVRHEFKTSGNVFMFFISFTLLFLFADIDYKSPLLYFGFCVFFTYAFLNKKIDSKLSASHKISILFFSIAFSIMLILKSHIVFTGDLRDNLTRNYLSPFERKDIFYFFLGTFVVYLTLIRTVPMLFYAAKKYHYLKKSLLQSWKHIVILAVSLLVP